MDAWDLAMQRAAEYQIFGRPLMPGEVVMSPREAHAAAQKRYQPASTPAWNYLSQGRPPTAIELAQILREQTARRAEENYVNHADRIVADEMRNRGAQLEAKAKMVMADHLTAALSDSADGTVITFDKRYDHSPGKKFTYAAIKVGGNWFATGKIQGGGLESGMEWFTFATFLVSGSPATNVKLLSEAAVIDGDEVKEIAKAQFPADAPAGEVFPGAPDVAVHDAVTVDNSGLIASDEDAIRARDQRDAGATYLGIDSEQ